MSDFSFSTALRLMRQTAPFAISYRLQAYFKLIVGQMPDPAWQSKLERALDKFKALKGRAYRWVLPRNMIGDAV